MGKKEILSELIKKTKINKELKVKIYKLLSENYDDMLVERKMEELLNGNFENIADEIITKTIQILDSNIQIEDNEQDKKEEIKQEEQNTLQNLYNTMLIENDKLRTENKKKESTINELKEEIDDLKGKLSKFIRMMELFKKYNISEIGQLVEIEDSEIDELYLRYLSEGTTQLNEAIIIETDESVIAPKTYYKLKKGDD